MKAHEYMNCIRAGHDKKTVLKIFNASVTEKREARNHLSKIHEMMETIVPRTKVF